MFEDTCTFSCDQGYELSGSETRTCQSNTTWNGTDVMCTPGMCVCVFVYSHIIYINASLLLHGSKFSQVQSVTIMKKHLQPECMYSTMYIDTPLANFKVQRCKKHTPLNLQPNHAHKADTFEL